MSYYIDIIDTLSNQVALKLEKASASGIILKWNGGDAKDELAIVTSELNFNMLSPDATDATFLKLFTGDEERFHVELKKSSDNSLLWQGFILPDQYSEPYQNGCFFVTFAAADGLGRLKGKYLPNSFYDQEKSLIAIYCECLRLTGLGLDLYFNPAIENFLNKDWNTIYINTSHFISKNKKQTAFQILETLLKDTLCVCYQADNRWYIEGINTRHIRKVNYKVYGFDGLEKNPVEYSRLLKTTKNLPTPLITMIPPYNEITVTHTKVAPNFSSNLIKEDNKGWAVVTGVTGEIHANEWMANGGLYANCIKPDYYVGLYNKSVELGGGNIDYPQDNTQWISLHEKVFFLKGQKAIITFNFKIKRPGISEANPNDMNLWKNPFKYEVIFNEVVLFSNYKSTTVTDQEKILFDENGTAELAIDYIFQNDGLLDFKIYRPFGVVNINRVEGVFITGAKIEVSDFEEEELISNVINAEFTIDKEVELNYADDKSGFSKSFLLSKLKSNSSFFNEIEVPISYVFPSDNKKCVVSLKGANLINQNLFSVYKNGVLVEIVNVFYNYQGGEQMVVETAVANLVSDVFTVKKYAVDDDYDSRNHWLKWSDSIYKIENYSYSQTVANIYRRLFNIAHEKIDMSVLNSVKFNDIILFNYVFEKDFYPINCSWNLDDNKSTLTLARSNYKNENSGLEDGNIPPIVLAGDDIYLGNTETNANLLAIAYDPDGYIVSQIWTLISGDSSMVIASPSQLSTALQNLTGDSYTLQIQVTDNDGATASDSLNILRVKQHVVTLDLIDETIDTSISQPTHIQVYKLNFTPELLAGVSVTLTGTINIGAFVNGFNNSFGEASYSIVKNGAVIESGLIYQPEPANPSQSVTPLTINYITGDVITIVIGSVAQAGDYGSGDTAQAFAQINLNQIKLNSGMGTFTGLPIQKMNQLAA